MHLLALEPHMEKARATVGGYSCSRQARVEERHMLHQKALSSHKDSSKRSHTGEASLSLQQGMVIESGRLQGLVLLTDRGLTSAAASESVLCE